MSVCPKCNRKLHIYEWRPNCPECGTNLMLYGFEERFYADAKAAEMNNANVRVKFQKFKVGLVGGALQIIRLVLCLLPVAAMLIPAGSFTVQAPLFSNQVSLSAFGLFSTLTDRSLLLLGSLSALPGFSSLASALKPVYFVYLASVLVAVITIVFSILSFLSFKKMSVLLCISSLLGAVLFMVEALIFRGVGDTFAGYSAISNVQNGYGAYLCAAMFICVFAVNLRIAINGLPIEFREGDLYRCEIRKKWLKKQISLDDIPFPIYESEQDRQERLEEAARVKKAREIGGDAK